MNFPIFGDSGVFEYANHLSSLNLLKTIDIDAGKQKYWQLIWAYLKRKYRLGICLEKFANARSVDELIYGKYFFQVVPQMPGALVSRSDGFSFLLLVIDIFCCLLVIILH